MQNSVIPTVDVSDLKSPRTLSGIDRACAQWGVFRVSNHGIDRVELQQAMQAFFSLPAQSKFSLYRTADNPWGYYDRELTKNTRDRKEIFDAGPEGEVTPWPAKPSGFRTVLRTHAQRCHELGLAILDAIAHNLGVPAAVLTGSFRNEHTSFLRLNFYPDFSDTASAGNPASGYGDLALNPHSDAGAVTVLCQDDKAGLEVLHDSRWYAVTPEPGTLVVNIGDIVQVWSNDRYLAPVHRVSTPDGVRRYSAAYFLNPSYETDYAPLGQPAGGPRYRPINWGEFRRLRAMGDYGNYGEEVQISRYRM